MDKLAIITEVRRLLGPEYKNAIVSYNNVKKPFYSFLEEDFSKIVLDGANPQNLVFFIKKELLPKIRFDSRSVKLVNEFIDNYPNYKDMIQISENEYMSAKEYLFSYVIKNLDEQGNITYPGKDSITVEELYKKLLEKEYVKSTIEDKMETIEYMIEHIDTEILNSVIKEYNVTVRDYLLSVPELMVDYNTVKIGNQTIEITEFVKYLVDHQRTVLTNEEEKQKLEEAEKIRQSKVEMFNKTGDNPGLVDEIRVALNEGNIEVTTTIPEVKSSLLTDEELSDLSALYNKFNTETNEDFMKKQLTNIKKVIDKSRSEHDLKVHEETFNRLKEMAKTISPSNHIKSLCESISSMIVMKRNNLIKVQNNQEDYIDVIFSEVNNIKNEIDNNNSADDFSKIIGKLTFIQKEINDKGIKDIQLSASIYSLFKEIRKKEYIFDATKTYESTDEAMRKAYYQEKMMNIKKDLLNNEHNPNNVGNYVGTSIRIENDINEVKTSLFNDVKDGFFKNDMLFVYSIEENLKNFKAALQSEYKIGYGTR